jgi:2-methylcitrate synthase
MGMEEVRKGLDGVVADETAICEARKGEDRLFYRGYAVEELAEKSSYEEVAYLLQHGELPDVEALDAQYRAVLQAQQLPQLVADIVTRLPAEAIPADVLRTGVSALGIAEPETGPEALALLAPGLPAALASIVFGWFNAGRGTGKADTGTGEPTVAGHILHLLGGQPSELRRRALDVSLIVYAEHDFNASTYAARIAASTLSDIYSSLVAAIGALRGPLHGGASEAVAMMFDRFSSADEAEKAVREILSAKKRVFGFGQRAYAKADPRNAINREWARRLSAETGDVRIFKVAERIEAVVAAERGLFANLDYYTAVIYRLCGIPTPLFPALFMIARSSGIVAHVAEQRATNRLIHPSSKYIGPAPRAYGRQARVVA